MKKWINVLAVLILLGLGIFSGKGVYKYNVFSTHDGNHHISRSFDAIQSFSEGQFPLRWAGSLNFNCGVPIYNFFYPLIYYLVVFVNYLSSDGVIESLKHIYFSTFLLGPPFLYLWLKNETKSSMASFGGAFLYLFVPYRFSLIFVRGSPEFLSYAILPIVLYFYSLLFSAVDEKKRITFAFLASIFGALLAISHNFTVMFLLPLVLLYILIKIYPFVENHLKSNLRSKISRKKEHLRQLISDKGIILPLFSFVSIFLLAGFFIIPALIEQKYVQIGKGEIIKIQEHFPTLMQLIRSRWDYFYSSPGVENDGMSFMLGYAQWLVLGISGIWIFFRAKAKSLKKSKLLLLLFGLSGLTVFMILPYSWPIWKILPILQQIQFSWRFLGIAALLISVLFAFLIRAIENKSLKIFIFSLTVILAFIGNRNHLLPQPVSVEIVHQYDDYENLHPHRFSTTTLGDDAISIYSTKACNFDTTMISLEGSKNIPTFQILDKNNSHFSLLIDNTDFENSINKRIILALEYFPEIHNIFVNGKKVETQNCSGRACIDLSELSEGSNIVEWRLGQTQVQHLSNWITVVTFIVWVVILLLVFFPKLAKQKKYLLLIIPTILFMYSRQIDQSNIIFNWDQERDAQAIRQIIQDHKFWLIGPRVLGPSGFYLPPYFFYLLLPFYFLTNLDPQALILFLQSYNLLFFLASVFVLKKVLNLKTAAIFLAFWTLSPLTISMDRISWNPLLIPLFFILLIFSLYKYHHAKQKQKYALISGLIFGLGLSFHIQFLLLFPLILIFIKNVKELMIMFASVAAIFLPILLFDLRHNFLNTNLVLEMIGSSQAKDYFSFLPVLRNFMSQLFSLNLNINSTIFIYLILLLIAVVLFKYSKTDFEKLLQKGIISILLFTPVVFGFWGQRPSEYYFNYLAIIVFLNLSLIIVKVLEKYIKSAIFLFILVFCLLYVYFPPSFIHRSCDSIESKKAPVSLLSGLKKSKEFQISFDLTSGQDTGFRYLLELNNLNDTRSDIPLVEFTSKEKNEGQSFNFCWGNIYFPGNLLKIEN